MNEGGGPASRDSAGQGARGASAGVDGDARGFSRTVDRDVSSGPAREASGGDAAGTTGLGADAPGSGGREPGRGDPDQGGVGQGGPGQGGSGKSVATVFGEIVWLMSQSPLHKSFRIADLEWLVMPPVLLRQFRLFYEGEKPVGAVLYAFLSDEAEARLEAGTGPLGPQDWKSGDRAWIVEVLAPFGGAEAMAQDTAATVLAGRTVKLHVTDQGGRRVVVVGEEERA